MKKVIWLLIIGLIYSVPTFAESELQQNQLISPPLITGTFSGNFFDGADSAPVVTIFLLNEHYVGAYAFEGESGLEIGKLTNLRTDGSFTVLVDWEDNTGSGVLRMLFSSDYSTFYGFWGESQEETTLLWNGVKNEQAHRLSGQLKRKT